MAPRNSLLILPGLGPSASQYVTRTILNTWHGTPQYCKAVMAHVLQYVLVLYCTLVTTVRSFDDNFLDPDLFVILGSRLSASLMQ